MKTVAFNLTSQEMPKKKATTEAKPKYRKLKNGRFAKVLPSGKLKFISKAAAVSAGLVKAPKESKGKGK